MIYLGLVLWCGTVGLITLVFRNGRGAEADAISDEYRRRAEQRLAGLRASARAIREAEAVAEAAWG